MRLSICFYFKSCYVAQGVIELMTVLLPRVLRCWPMGLWDGPLCSTECCLYMSYTYASLDRTKAGRAAQQSAVCICPTRVQAWTGQRRAGRVLSVHMDWWEVDQGAQAGRSPSSMS